MSNTAPDNTKLYKSLKQSIFKPQGTFEKLYIKMMSTTFGKFLVSTSLTLQTSFSKFFSKFGSAFGIYFRKVFGEIMDTFQPIVDSIKALGGFVLNMVIKPMWHFFVKILSSISKFPIFSIPLKIVRSIGNAIWSSISTMFEFAGKMFGKVGKWLLKLPIRFIKGIFKFVGKVVWFTFETAFLFLRKASVWTISKVREIGEKMGQFLMGAIDVIGTILTAPGFIAGELIKLIPGGALIAPIISTAINAVLLGGAVVGGASVLGGALFNTGKGLLGSIFGGLGKILGDIWKKISKFFNDAWKKFDTTFPTLTKPIKKMLDWLGEVFKKVRPIWDEVISNTPKLFSDIFNILTLALKSATYQAMEYVWDYVKNKGKFTRNLIIGGAAAIAVGVFLIATAPVGAGALAVAGGAALAGGKMFVGTTVALTAFNLYQSAKKDLGKDAIDITSMPAKILGETNTHFKKTTEAIKRFRETAFPTFGDTDTTGGGGGGGLPSSGTSDISKTVAGRISQYEPFIQKYSQMYGVPANLVRGIIAQESQGIHNRTSPKGAYGLMQLMSGTAGDLGVDRFNAEENIKGGTKYIAQQLRTFKGDVNKALAAYNAGPGNVIKHKGIPPFKETQSYVGKVLGYSGMLNESTVAFNTDTKLLKDQNQSDSPLGKILAALGGAFTSITDSFSNLTADDLYNIGSKHKSAEISMMERKQAIDKVEFENQIRNNASNQAMPTGQTTSSTNGGVSTHLPNITDWVNTSGLVIMG